MTELAGSKPVVDSGVGASHDAVYMGFAEQFAAIDSLLVQTKALWQVQAFNCQQLPWRQQYPQLAQAVWQLQDSELEALDSCPETLFARLRPALQQDLKSEADKLLSLLDPKTLGLQLHNQVANHQSSTTSALSVDELPHFSAHIKGRKWQQIQAFAAVVPRTELPILEWCAGKGHLGRLLAKQHDCQVTSLEWQASLCQAGQVFADKWHLPQHFVCQDAFDESAAKHVQAKQTAVALHACGDLHVQLLKQASQSATEQIAISPCCYHLIRDKHYQPLSQLGQQSTLTLSRHDLQLPLQQSVIASDSQRQLRLQQVAWRLGFDSLQRYQRDVDEYLPVPTMKQSQHKMGFEHFCHWAAQQKQLKLTKPWCADSFLAQGIQRQRLTRRIDLVAHLFRHVLERWLLLDRVCYLQAHGYRVELFNFCDFTVTPRNALILAKKR